MTLILQTRCISGIEHHPTLVHLLTLWAVRLSSSEHNPVLVLFSTSITENAYDTTGIKRHPTLVPLVKNTRLCSSEHNVLLVFLVYHMGNPILETKCCIGNTSQS